VNINLPNSLTTGCCGEQDPALTSVVATEYVKLMVSVNAKVDGPGLTVQQVKKLFVNN
jgi:hypothetical protein